MLRLKMISLFLTAHAPREDEGVYPEIIVKEISYFFFPFAILFLTHVAACIPLSNQRFQLFFLGGTC